MSAARNSTKYETETSTKYGKECLTEAELKEYKKAAYFDDRYTVVSIVERWLSPKRDHIGYVVLFYNYTEQWLVLKKDLDAPILIQKFEEKNPDSKCKINSSSFIRFFCVLIKI